MTIIKDKKITSFGNDEEKLGPSRITESVIKWCVLFSICDSQKVEPTPTSINW